MTAVGFNAGFREFEQQRELRQKGLQTTSDQGTHDGSADSIESSLLHLKEKQV